MYGFESMYIVQAQMISSGPNGMNLQLDLFINAGG